MDEALQIIKYNNNLSELTLKNYTARERDLFMVLCSELRDSGKIEIPFSEIKSMANCQDISDATLVKDLDGLTDKLLSQKMKAIGDNGDIVKFSFFHRFVISPEKSILTASVGEEFVYLINSLGTNLTRSELAEHISLKSAYAKECYRQLVIHEGKWGVSSKRFRELMSIPDECDDEEIVSQIIPEIEQELKQLFRLFDVEIKYKDEHIDKYLFECFRQQASQ